MGRTDTRSVGRDAERLACRYLRTRGLRPVERNFRCRHGEIDLIMLDGDCLVFVEVRFRSSSAFGPASHSVDRRKQRKLAKAAAMYVAMTPGVDRFGMRFDVVGIDRQGDGSSTVEWLADAFHPG